MKVTSSAKTNWRDVGGDLVGGTGHADDEAPVLAHVDIALDHAQFAVVRRIAVAAAHLSEILRVGRRERRQLPAEKRLGAADIDRRGAGPSDLPVPARERQFEARIAHGTEIAVRIAGRHEVRRQRVGIDQKPLIEGPLGIVAIKRRQDEACDEQDDEAPEQGRDRQPDRDGASGQPIVDRREPVENRSEPIEDRTQAPHVRVWPVSRR